MAYENRVGNIITDADYGKLKQPLKGRYHKTTKKVPAKTGKVGKPNEVDGK